MNCLYQSLYQSQETGDVIRCINQQILCYITACDREQHMLNAAEDAITTYLIPKVEEMLVKDSMEGGEHSMSRRLHQGQQGLFYNGNAYIVNYQFAKGVMCDFYREAGIIPIECAQSVNYEGDRLLSMAQDLDSDMSGSDFVRKYKRNIPFKHRDYLMHGLGLSLQRVAENGFQVSELVDVYAFQRGVSFWVTADKKIMDNAMYVFIGWNRQALDMSKPMLEDGRLVVGGQEVRRYDIVYEFSLVDPKRSSEQMKLKASVDLVFEILDNSRHVRNITVDFTPEESAKITEMMKRLYFPADMPVKPHKVPVTIGQEFLDNYYFEYGTPEQKKSVEDKWASTDAGYRRILELNARNRGK